MTKVIVFLNSEGGVSSISPSYGDRLSVMSDLPRVDVIATAETEELAGYTKVEDIAPVFRPETDSEVLMRAAHCSLPVGKSFAIADALPPPVFVEGVPPPVWTTEDWGISAWPETSIGRDAIEVSWTNAAAAIDIAHQATLAAAREAAEVSNQANIAAWIEAHTPPEPEAEGEAEPQGEDESVTEDGDEPDEDA